ncbi:iron complex transport system ATP-binding protein [Thalassolituus maritimus]|uniref:Iron complex transport system ATP-binding protein n=1 Tax=Thalassolituus maritimus TaxID=484498 RepID=A0A1N7LRF9_9GAMM|nr:heme ABC transporter ATP-binding protein [Thalassolituus maritimus]SIS76426.1 iron complex transport system ATP-binding protein [Thalassolituus maritimus]
MTLRVRSVSLNLHNRRLLENVSFDLHAGDRVAVLGANGAGKSTLLKCLTGEYTAVSGAITLDGRRLGDLPAAERALKMAVMPQGMTLAFPLRVCDVVALGRSRHMDERRSRHWQKAAMEMMDVWHLRSREYPTLSGGEQQRTQMARVLVQIWDCHQHSGDGYFLLLDECFSAADPAHQHSMMEKVGSFADRGVGVLAVMHDMSLAAAWADRVLLLKQGKVTASGPVELLTLPHILQEVYDLPKSLADDYARNNRHWLERNAGQSTFIEQSRSLRQI